MLRRGIVLFSLVVTIAFLAGCGGSAGGPGGSLPPATTASVLISAQNGKRASTAQLNGEAVWEKSKVVSGVSVKAEKNGVRIELRKQGRYEIVARY